MALAKTLQQIANQVGKTLLLYDGTTWKTDKDVTQADIKEYINLLYQDEVFPKFVNEYPGYYKTVGTLDSWVASGTADAGLSGSTLTATSSIFTSSMADQQLYVYNSTDDVSTTITAYTSGTTVTVDEDDLSDWSGDTIYVLGQEFSLGGDGVDTWAVTNVGIKYSTSDTDYRIATKAEESDLKRSGFEVGSEGSPKWYDTSILDSNGDWQTAIGIWPGFDTKVTKAIRVEYTAKVPALDDTDTPRLPVSLPLIFGAVAMAFDQKGEERRAETYWNRYQMRLEMALQNWRPDRGQTARTMKMSRKYINRRNNK